MIAKPGLAFGREGFRENKRRVKSMKTFVAVLWLIVATTGALAQGLINFANSPTTLISVGAGAPVGGGLVCGPVGTYLFGLLVSPTATGPFTFAGLYASNLVTSSGGRFSGGNGIAVPGWLPGQTMYYEIAGWRSISATTYNPAWIRADGSTSYSGPNPFGISAIGSGVAGGGPQSLPPLPLFGGVSGIPTGFSLGVIPEPSVASLGCLGATLLWIFSLKS